LPLGKHTKVKKSVYRPDRPWGLQGVETPRFQDNRRKKVVSLWGLRTGRIYPQEIFLVLISIRGGFDSKGHSEAGRIMWMKNSNDTIRNRTSDLQTYSAVPQSTVPPLASGQTRDSYAGARLWYFQCKYPRSYTAHFANQYCRIIFIYFCLLFVALLAWVLLLGLQWKLLFIQRFACLFCSAVPATSVTWHPLGTTLWSLKTARTDKQIVVI